MAGQEVNPAHEELLKQLRGVQLIVINTTYGGFDLSHEAVLLYLELTGTPYHFCPQEDRERQTRLGDRIIVDNEEFYARGIVRNDPALVAVIRRLGSKANGEYSKLKIVEVPAGVAWHVNDYDGKEWIAENHRTWR